jgi:hypothetical protein
MAAAKPLDCQLNSDSMAMWYLFGATSTPATSSYEKQPFIGPVDSTI